MPARILTRGLNRLRRISQNLAGFLAGVERRRHANPYATHLPVLLGLARLYPVRRVLELGCGFNSTLTFLNRAAFGNLQSLVSYENDPQWARQVAARAGNDSRLTLHQVAGPIHTVVRGLDLGDYDLVLVDDATEAAQRAATIRAVAGRCPAACLVAIHDFEVEAYQSAARAFRRSFCFTAFNPHTGLAWNDARRDTRHLKRLNALIRRRTPLLAPDDLAGWGRALAAVQPIF